MDIQRGKSKAVTLLPASRMTSPTAVIYDRLGDVVVPAASLTATPSAVSTTVVDDVANSRSSIELASVVGIAQGLHVEVVMDGWGTVVTEVATVAGSVVHLIDPLPAVPSAGAVVRGLDVAVTIPSTATADLGLGYVLEVTEGDESVRLMFAVVVYPSAQPCTARHVRDKVSRGYPGESGRNEAWYQRVANACNLQLRARLLGSGKYLSHFWDPTSVAAAVPAMLTLVLAEQFGLRESGPARDDGTSDPIRDANLAMSRLVTSAQPYDHDGDGKIETTDDYRSWSVELVR